MSDQYVSADFGTLPKSSEDFGKVPNVSEEFRTVPNASEGFGSIPKGSEGEPARFQKPIVSKPENVEAYTMTVREAARVFEDAGLASTEMVEIVGERRAGATGDCSGAGASRL